MDFFLGPLFFSGTPTARRVPPAAGEPFVHHSRSKPPPSPARVAGRKCGANSHSGYTVQRTLSHVIGRSNADISQNGRALEFERMCPQSCKHQKCSILQHMCIILQHCSILQHLVSTLTFFHYRTISAPHSHKLAAGAPHSTPSHLHPLISPTTNPIIMSPINMEHPSYKERVSQGGS